jgi:hypothetical protein
MSSVAQRLRRHLDEHGVAYRLLEHEPAGTAEEYHALLGTRYEQQAKSVFVRHKGGAGGWICDSRDSGAEASRPKAGRDAPGGAPRPHGHDRGAARNDWL